MKRSLDYAWGLSGGLEWKIDALGLTLVLQGVAYRVKNTAILANGTQDVLIVDNGGVLEIASINHPFKGKVLYAPKHDLAVFYFAEPLPAPSHYSYLILEIDEALEPLIRELSHRWPMIRREEYDAFLGRDYWRVV